MAARKAIIVKNKRKAALAEKQRELRVSLRKAVRNESLSEEEGLKPK